MTPWQNKLKMDRNTQDKVNQMLRNYIKTLRKNNDKRKAEQTEMDLTSEVQSSTVRELSNQDVGEFSTELDVEDVLAN